MVELDVVERLLGVPPGYPRWRVADMAVRAKVLPTWLSTVVARGGELSPAAREHLDRAGRRVAALHRTGAELAAAHGVTVIKGAAIAARMPAGVLRNSGDADVVAPDEAALWRCVLDLRERCGAVPQGVNVLDSAAGRDLVVALKWPAEEPDLDKPLGADVATCAFCGDMTAVPVRRATPADQDVCSLFAVAEERFQRRYSRKDMLDLVVLAEVLAERFGPDLAGLVADTAAELRLAPELRKLIGKTTEWVPLPPEWTAVASALDPVVAREKERRRATAEPVTRLRFGYPLDERDCGELAVRAHPFDGGELISTPVGTCLLVDSPTIPAGLLAAAERRAGELR
jgi:hypothetical protein